MINNSLVFELLLTCYKYGCFLMNKPLNVKELASYNPGQNIWHKVKKYSKIGQDFKNVTSNFACFLTATVNV